ncbi:LysM peptidoglycan-binding domain-containing protein [Zooshikella ganghwensis]|uniref:LysM peptidoglycan-binding domain-containing protein n=1 Tax=Zooshikella ganghwensis TaxID=202772 RepID=UPI0004008C7A|nr:LysM peptidoglycan-binding domain-containing protein [Zooshikella ganghwensis]
MSSNKIYRIQPGDTLATIALKNGVSVEDLRQANPGITDDNLIYANTNIRIPEPSCDDPYVIKRGDTLGDLAKKHDTTVDEILKENKDIKDPDKIYAGYELKIPGQKPGEECPVPPEGGPRTGGPGIGGPGTGGPGTGGPGTGGPGTGGPGTGGPGTGGPGTGGPGTGGPGTGGPGTGGPGTGGPGTGGPETEGPKKKGPEKQEPEKIEEPKDKKKTEEPKKEEPKAEEQLPEDKDKPCEECDSKCRVRVGCKHDSRSIVNPPYLAVVPSGNDKGKIEEEKYKEIDSDLINVRIEGNQAPEKVQYGSETFDKKGKDQGNLFYIPVGYMVPKKKPGETIILEDLVNFFHTPVNKKNKITGDCIDLPVHVHSPDVWEVKIGFPEWDKIEHGTKKVGRIENGKFKKEKTFYKRRAFENEATLDHETGEFKYEPASVSTGGYDFSNFDVGVSVKKNNKSIGIDSAKALFQPLEVAAAISRLITQLRKSFNVKWGVYFDVTFAVMKGGILVKWYNKENDDHTASKIIEAGIFLEFINLELEMGVGIQVSDHIGAQLFVKCSGKVEAQRYIQIKDNEKKVVIPFTGGIGVEVGLRCKVSDNFTAEGIFSSGFETKADFEIDPSAKEHIFTVKGEVVWTGVKGVVKASLAFGQSNIVFDCEKEFIPKYKITDFSFPDTRDYESTFASEKEIKKLFVEQMESSWWKNKIKITGVRNEERVYINTKQLAETLTNGVIDSQKVSRDLKTIKLIAEDVYDELRVYEENKSWYIADHVTLDEYNNFIDCEYPKILQKYPDQARLKFKELKTKK